MNVDIEGALPRSLSNDEVLHFFTWKWSEEYASTWDREIVLQVESHLCVVFFVLKMRLERNSMLHPPTHPRIAIAIAIAGSSGSHGKHGWMERWKCQPRQLLTYVLVHDCSLKERAPHILFQDGLVSLSVGPNIGWSEGQQGQEVEWEYGFTAVAENNAAFVAWWDSDAHIAFLDKYPDFALDKVFCRQWGVQYAI